MRHALPVLAAVLLLTISNGLPMAQGALVSSAGPLEDIDLSTTLSCQVSHFNDVGNYQFYPSTTIPGDCGTLLVVDRTLYAPAFSASTATGGLGATTAFTSTGAQAVSGTGTLANPHKVVTSVAAGTSGVTVEQTDTYVVGDDFFRTDMEVTNTGSSSRAIVLYRAGDCYLGGSDSGYGFAHRVPGSVGCSLNPLNTPQGRFEEWEPLTPGSTHMEGLYSDVWTHIGSTHVPFPNTVQGAILQDNGAGISWAAALLAGQSLTFSSILRFSVPFECSLGGLTVAEAYNLHVAMGPTASPPYPAVFPLGKVNLATASFLPSGSQKRMVPLDGDNTIGPLTITFDASAVVSEASHTASSISALSRVEGLSIALAPFPGNILSARVLQAASHTTPALPGSSTSDGTAVAGLQVLNQPPQDTVPPPNTLVQAPGVTIILNEQHATSGASGSSLRVNLVHLFVDTLAGQTLEVIVSSAGTNCAVPGALPPQDPRCPPDDIGCIPSPKVPPILKLDPPVIDIDHTAPPSPKGLPPVLKLDPPILDSNP